MEHQKVSITNDFSRIYGFKKLFKNYPYKSYYYYDFDEVQLTEVMLEQIERQNDATYITAVASDNTMCFSSVLYLEFDSSIFGLKVGRVSQFITNVADPRYYIDKLCQFCIENDYDFVDISINTMESQLLPIFQDKGFCCLGVITTYSIDISREAKQFKREFRGLIRELEDDDVDFLLEIVESSFSGQGENQNRFFLDINLPNNKVGKLYRRWFENCVSGERAGKILVAETEGIPVGFIACDVKKIEKFEAKIGTVPLNAISKDYRRQGIYKALVSEALNWFIEEKCKYVEIRTQLSTLAPQYVWQNFSGRLVKSEYVFHKWFK